MTRTFSMIRAPRSPGALGQREGQVGRVGLAVGGQPDRADQVVDPHHRIVLESLLGT